MRMLIKELKPSQGAGTCSPRKNGLVPLFPKNKILIFYVPCSLKLPMFACSPYFYVFIPLFPWKNALVPLFPKTLGGPQNCLSRPSPYPGSAPATFNCISIRVPLHNCLLRPWTCICICTNLEQLFYRDMKTEILTVRKIRCFFKSNTL